MNRLVRIALTMFVSATILLFLVANRGKKAEQLQASAHGNPATMELVKKEVHMAWLGIVIAGGLMGGGISLMITAFVRSRKKPAATESNG